MAEQKGQYYSLSYEATKLGKIINLSLSIDGNQINISNFDSGEFEEFLAGRKNWTISFTCRYDQADTNGQLNVIDDLLAGNNGAWNFGPETTTTGDVSYSGTGNPSNITIDAPDDDVMEISGDVQGTGTLTKSVAA